MRSVTVRKSSQGFATEVQIVHEKSMFRYIFGMKPWCESFINLNDNWLDSFTYEPVSNSELGRIYDAIAWCDRQERYHTNVVKFAKKLTRGQ
jgi:hypothetical protein